MGSDPLSILAIEWGCKSKRGPEILFTFNRDDDDDDDDGELSSSSYYRVIVNGCSPGRVFVWLAFSAYTPPIISYYHWIFTSTLCFKTAFSSSAAEKKFIPKKDCGTSCQNGVQRSHLGLQSPGLPGFYSHVFVFSVYYWTRNILVLQRSSSPFISRIVVGWVELASRASHWESMEIGRFWSISGFSGKWPMLDRVSAVEYFCLKSSLFCPFHWSS